MKRATRAKKAPAEAFGGLRQGPEDQAARSLVFRSVCRDFQKAFDLIDRGEADMEGAAKACAARGYDLRKSRKAIDGVIARPGGAGGGGAEAATRACLGWSV